MVWKIRAGKCSCVCCARSEAERCCQQSEHRRFTRAVSAQMIRQQAFWDAGFPAGPAIKLDPVRTARMRAIFAGQHEPRMTAGFLHVLTAAGHCAKDAILKDPPF